MVDELYSQLQEATFRGVPFLFVSSSRAGGRKTTSHEYPNTNRRYVEDLGKVVPTFTIAAIQTGGPNGYFDYRDRFIEALEEFGPGQLSHPFYGVMMVAALEYTVEENTTKLGECTFNITFAITGSSSGPITNRPLQPAALRAGLVSSIPPIEQTIFQTIEAPTGSKYGVQFLVSLFNRAVTTVQQETTKIKGLLDGDSLNFGIEQSSANTSFNDLQTNAYTTVQDPAQIAAALPAIFDTVDSITDADPHSIYTAYTGCFNFGSDSIPQAPTTSIQQTNANNFYTVVNNYNILALSYAYDAATELEYFTADDIERIRAQLEAQYQYILGLPRLNRDCMDSLRNMRTMIRQFFEDTGKNVYRLLPIKTPLLPLSVLTFQYYGNLDNREELGKINNITDPSFVSGTINIFVAN